MKPVGLEGRLADLLVDEVHPHLIYEGVVLEVLFGESLFHLKLALDLQKPLLVGFLDEILPNLRQLLVLLELELVDLGILGKARQDLQRIVLLGENGGHHPLLYALVRSYALLQQELLIVAKRVGRQYVLGGHL